MNARDLIDATRLQYVTNPSISPTRGVTYTRDTDAVSVVLNSFVGVGLFNKTEKEFLGRYESFGGLILSVEPQVLDTVTFGGVKWKVVRYTKMGSLYTVICENKRHNGRPV